MAKALTLVVGESAKETARFAEMFDKFFDCMNCSSLSAGKRTRNPFKSPFRSATDWKLKVHTPEVCNVDITSATTHTVVVEGGIPIIP